MRWNFAEAKENWAERHLETNTFTDRQKLKLHELNLVRLLTNEICDWLLKEKFVLGNNNAIPVKFEGSLRRQWVELERIGNEIMNAGSFSDFWTDKFKFEMGLNLLQLIFDSLVLIDDRATFIYSAREVGKALSAMGKGAKVWITLLREVQQADCTTDHGQGFFDRTEILISSTALGYQCKILEKVEHNIRKVADLFF